MSIFGDIWQKITGAQPAATPAAVSDPPTTQTAQAQSQSQSQEATTSAPAPAAMSEVDVEAVLTKLAAEKGDGDNWRTSIVDLLKLLDLDSSLAARTTLAHELDVHAGSDGSAEQNMALHRAVVQKMEENGGKVPDSMKV
jgi:hypothetical protein